MMPKIIEYIKTSKLPKITNKENLLNRIVDNIKKKATIKGKNAIGRYTDDVGNNGKLSKGNKNIETKKSVVITWFVLNFRLVIYLLTIYLI